LLLLLPVTFIFVVGYAVEATRVASDGRSEPPDWGALARLERFGRWTSIALILLTAPFAIVWIPLSSAFHNPALWQSTGTLLDVEAGVAAALILALPWGVVLLVLMPHATVRFAASQKARHLFDFASSMRSVRREFATWNLTIAAIVTGWAVGVACVALLCAGLAPGIFYAILVSAHATAALHPEGESPSAG
jgi:hypothetical protein